ncbi:MAG: hypothetical protein J6A89_04520 [Clostridia bacterium]|nr:hypothetical protein [Clostridia bacterium]
MDILNRLKKIDKKILHIGIVGLKICLIISLLSAMMLCFYKSTDILFQYEIGVFMLKIGILFSCFFVICTIAFDRIVKDIF